MKQKSFSFLLILLMSMTANVAMAYDVVVDGIYYNLSGVTATVTYKDGNYNSYSGSVTIPESVTYNDKIYSVNSIGEDAFQSCSGLTSVTIPNSVTSIGKYAFYFCSSLTSITIPNSVTSICEYAFLYCSSLTSVTIGSGVTSIDNSAFYCCSSLTSVTIGSGVTSIGNSAFSGCSGLTSITIPKSVTSIGNSAFYGCSGLTSIKVAEGNAKYDSRNNCNAIIETETNILIAGCENTLIPNSVTNISEGAFTGCSGLTSITIPKSVTGIGNRAFSGCSGLTSVIIPKSVTGIGNRAFSGCSGLTSIKVAEGNAKYDSRNNCNAIIETETNILIAGCENTLIPNSVTNISEGAFTGCSGLTSINIPNGVTSIGNFAFSGCSGLTSITIPNSVTSIGDFAFFGCSGLTSITIPNSVTSIGDNAFSGCYGLTSISIPNSVTSIGMWAFHDTAWHNNQPDGLVYAGKVAYTYKGIMPEGTHVTIEEGTLGIAGGAFCDCWSLTAITIPESVTNIGYGAFWRCFSLTSITIPSSVTSIGANAFSDCSGLTVITIPENVTSIDYAAFEGCSSLTSIKVGMKTPISTNASFISYERATLYVPKGSKIAYQAAYPWSRFKNIVECNYVDVESQSIAAGNSTTMDIEVNNFESNVVGFQMDLTLPKGVSIDKTGYTLSSRITDEEQELVIGKLENGDYRITSSSLSLTPISGNDGTLLTLKLTAEDGCIGGQATISNILFSTSESETISMDDETFDIGILYNLTYKVDGEEYKTSSVICGAVLIPESNPTKEGYTFGGWDEIPETMPAHDVIISGSFTINSYTLTYNIDGEEYKISPVIYGTAITPEAEPTKEGYTFSGWSELPETMPAKDVTVTGTFTVNNYNLTYKVDGEEYKTSSIAFGTTLTPESNPTRKGYTFNGWSEIPETMPAKDVTVTGTFTVNNYKLTYMVDGEEYKTISVEYGSTIIPEDEPTKEGYTFGGWSEIPEMMLARDVVITGRFYCYGDVNTDEAVNVVDVVDIARFVVATPSVKFREKLSDLNYDKTVNIADAVVLVNHIAGDQNFVKAMVPQSMSYDYDLCQLQLLNTGKNALSLCLNGEADFTAFQFDVDIPEGTDISAIRINGLRKDGHQLLYNKVEENRYRVTALSLSNAVFKGNMGELLQFSINGKAMDDICVHDIHFVTTNGKDITFDALYVSESETGIADVNASDNNDVIYDLQGRKLSKAQRGVNIINGKKVIVK